MQVQVNGDSQTLHDGMTVMRLLDQRRIQPIRVAVEINETVISRKEFAETVIHAGDRIEIVTLVGGG